MKIRYLIDTFLSPQIGALDWVGRYGGVVKTMYKEFEDQNDKFKTKRFPVASDVSAKDCDNLSVLQDLVPNDNYKSVVYWEELSPLTNVGYTQTKKFTEKKFKGTARLIVWLNLAKLGITNSKDGFLVIPSLEKILTVKGKIQSGVLAGAHLWIEPKQIVNQDINTVFGKYDYPKTINYYLGSEFDFCAIDVEFTLEQCLSNDTVLPILPSVDCANGEPPTPCVPLPVTCQEKLDFIAPVRDTCFIPSLAFEAGNDSDFNALSLAQVSDLGLRICSNPILTQYSMSFDGVNEYVYAHNEPEFNFTNLQPFSICAWVKSSNYAGNYQGILSKRDGATFKGYSCFFYLGDLYVVLRSSAGNFIFIRTTGVSFVNSTWYHVGVTILGNSLASGIKIYVNGVQKTTVTIQDNLNATIANSQPLLIGTDLTGGFYFGGKIGYTSIFNIELSGANMITEYNIGTMLENSPQAASQVMFWKSGQSALFGGNDWLFPNALDINKLAPYSVNCEQADRTTDVPV